MQFEAIYERGSPAMSDLDPVESMIFDKRPGVVLAPYEALLAQIMWTAESVRRGDGASNFQEVFRSPPRVDPRMRRRILTAHLLFGPLDAVSGLFLLDRWLSRRGSSYSRREIVGDLIPWEIERSSPFAHSLEQGHLSHPMSTPKEASKQIDQMIIRKSLALAARRALNRAGEPATAEEVIEHVDAGVGPWLPPSDPDAEDRRAIDLMISSNSVSRALFTTLSSISRSVSMGVPYLSVDAAGPAWVGSGLAEPRLHTFQFVLDAVKWLPRPRSFHEAVSMADDERIQDLKNHINMWTEALMTGELSNFADLARLLNEDIKSFQGRRWAAEVSRVVTYVSVPTGVAEMYMGNTGMGLGLTGLGATAQLISDLDARSRKGSWLSLGRDFIRDD